MSGEKSFETILVCRSSWKKGQYITLLIYRVVSPCPLHFFLELAYGLLAFGMQESGSCTCVRDVIDLEGYPSLLLPNTPNLIAPLVFLPISPAEVPQGLHGPGAHGYLSPHTNAPCLLPSSLNHFPSYTRRWPGRY